MSALMFLVSGVTTGHCQGRAGEHVGRVKGQSESRRLANVAAQCRADALECLCQRTGQCLHASGRPESNQSYDESVLHQILPLFAVEKKIEFRMELLKLENHRLTSLWLAIPD
jgi:hypothetical protein